VYGTAWKEDRTGEFTKTALTHGFFALDTANYPTAYNESLTGEAIEELLKGGLKREDLFVSN